MFVHVATEQCDPTFYVLLLSKFCSADVVWVFMGGVLVHFKTVVKINKKVRGKQEYKVTVLQSGFQTTVYVFEPKKRVCTSYGLLETKLMPLL